MDQITDDETPIYTKIRKEYAAAGKLSELFGPNTYLETPEEPLSADD